MHAVVASEPRVGASPWGGSPPDSGWASAMSFFLPRPLCCDRSAYGANSAGITVSGQGVGHLPHVCEEFGDDDALVRGAPGRFRHGDHGS
ncbi:hypothetical protein GCM10010230_64120 [Streptomyces narbonensis]|nr:hypothetical protein GCM10010230_64120 [Streptomyces narbonensis]